MQATVKIILLISLLMLTGCGQKGALYLPTDDLTQPIERNRNYSPSTEV
jgi:predicted small lipoprotein YifL